MKDQRINSTVTVDVSRCSTGSCAPVAREEVIEPDERNATDVTFIWTQALLLYQVLFLPWRHARHKLGSQREQESSRTD